MNGHAITKDIAGTIETISKITPEILYKCYNTFYDTSNMVMCVVGNVNPDEVLSIIKSDVKMNNLDFKIDRFISEDSEAIHKKEIIKKMDISMPMFTICFKDTFNRDTLNVGFSKNSMELAKRDVAVQIALSLIVGKSTDFYQELYDNGLVMKPFGYSYTFEENYAYSIIESESNSYREVIEKVTERIKNVKENKINNFEFENIKKTMYGDYVRMFNDVNSIATTFVSNYFRGIDTSDYEEVFKCISIKDVEDVINEHFDFEKMAVSIIEPKT